MDANEISRERNRILLLVAKYRRADGSIPADIRDSLVWINSMARRWALENPGCV